MITAIQRQLLRSALGLTFYTKTPARNWLPDAEARRHEPDVAELERLGCLVVRHVPGPGGMERHIEITEAGRELAMQTPPQPQ